jgi:flavin reductase (DIM6/NTAB) family NADH-FMN oxidoreductase RutF
VNTRLLDNDSVRYSYEPLQGHGLPHDPLPSMIAPRPIGWISSIGAGGNRNLAPYSFFNLFNYKPPILGFASIGWKDSIANITETREFVWNMATRPLAEAMNATSAAIPRDMDEFTHAALAALPGWKVKVDRVAASPVHCECRLTQCIQLETAAGAKVETWLVLGEVIAVHIDRRCLDANGIFLTATAQPILRAGGASTYFGISESCRFEIHRPS